MKITMLKCPNCGATHAKDLGKGKAKCKHCSTVFGYDYTPDTVENKTVVINLAWLKVAIPIAVFIILVIGVVLLINLFPSKQEDTRIFKTAGVYEVGKDLPSGEYLLYPNLSETKATLEVRLTKEQVLDKKDLVYSFEFYGRQYVNLNDGEFVEFIGADLYLPEKVKLKKLSTDGYVQAQLKVGTDIPAGDYIICTEDSKISVVITSVPEAGMQDLNDETVLLYKTCESRCYVTVKNGEYLLYLNSKLYKVDDAPKIELLNGGYRPAHYKINQDIQSGKYIVKIQPNQRCTIEIIKNSTLFSQFDYTDGAEQVYEINPKDGDEIEIPYLSNSDDDYYIYFSGAILVKKSD